MKKFYVVMLALLVSGCLGIPRNVTPVTDFDLDRYLGTWYEIARLDHSFERGLEQVSAEYALRTGGGITVTNRGFEAAKNEWAEAKGKAFFVGDENEGHLKVSFFGPFYGSYVIFGLDPENYQYAFVCGANTSYLWLLSRTPTVDEDVMERFIERADSLGFDTDALIYVKH
ncbi:MAG: lipocalin family protein [Candidatus Omnitrophica bacterium]|nr:lipocalin family protein [Candidatus Omnitrophota bacterium]